MSALAQVPHEGDLEYAAAEFLGVYRVTYTFAHVYKRLHHWYTSWVLLLNAAEAFIGGLDAPEGILHHLFPTMDPKVDLPMYSPFINPRGYLRLFEAVALLTSALHDEGYQTPSSIGLPPDESFAWELIGEELQIKPEHIDEATNSSAIYDLGNPRVEHVYLTRAETFLRAFHAYQEATAAIMDELVGIGMEANWLDALGPEQTFELLAEMYRMEGRA